MLLFIVTLPSLPSHPADFVLGFDQQLSLTTKSSTPSLLSYSFTTDSRGAK